MHNSSAGSLCPAPAERVAAPAAAELILLAGAAMGLGFVLGISSVSSDPSPNPSRGVKSDSENLGGVMQVSG